jgi:HK97 family phage major capsid protein
MADSMHEKLQAELIAARNICDAVEKAGREFTTDERTQIEGHMKAAKELKDKLKAAKDDAALRQMLTELGDGIALEERERGKSGVAPGRGKTLGEQFAESPEFKAWMKQIAPTGRIADGLKGLQSPPVEFKALFKTLITGSSDTSAGAFVETDYTGIYEPLGRHPRTVLDMISRRSTDSDLVEFVRQTAQVTQSTPVQEANVTTYAASTGQIEGAKPEGAATWEKVQETVKTIAVWIPATKRALSDASQLRGLLDQELREDCLEELEDQIINGDGTGENFTGILNTTGVLTQAWNTDLITTTRKAITAVRVTGKARGSLAWAMNPSDAETVDLLKDGDNRYYWGGPVSAGTRNLWGYPIVENNQVDQGKAILGQWDKAVYWDRQAATISVSDSHSDFFIRNMIAILCELRGAFGLIRPSNFVIVDMESGT